MDPSDSPLPPPILPRSTPNKETPASLSSKIAELSESRSELLGRIQGLKQDLQSWRSKLDTQVKVYRDELQELKNSLNNEVVILQTEFKDLRTTLLQQQDDVEASLRNDGAGEVENPGVTANEETSFVGENHLSNENGEVLDDLSSSSQTVEHH